MTLATFPLPSHGLPKTGWLGKSKHNQGMQPCTLTNNPRLLYNHPWKSAAEEKRMRGKIWLMLCGLLCLALPSYAQEATPEATEEAAPPQVLTIWWPDALVSPDNEDALDTLLDQTEDFATTQENTEVVLRLKRVGTIGGIMPTLRTASIVAPNALPTLTLVRRQDLISLVRSGTVQSLENAIPSSIISDLGTTLPLGQVNGELYGIPYMLAFQHLVYRPQPGVDYQGWSYTDLLAREQGFVFPASQATGVSDVLLLQYLAAGGTLNRDGELLLDEEALVTTLSFYEAASDAALVTGFTLNYPAQEEYRANFLNGEINTAVFDSHEYLSMVQDEPELQIAPIPTPTGEQAAILNGWMWVMIAPDREQRQLALDYIRWMMEPARQTELASEALMLPSQLSALEESSVSEVELDPYIGFLESPFISPAQAEVGSLGQLLQEATASVITLERTTEEATEYVLDRHDGDAE